MSVLLNVNVLFLVFKWRCHFELISNVLTFSFIWSNTVFIGWLLLRRPGLLYNISI